MKRHEVREVVVLENKGMKLFGILHKPLVQKKAPAVMIFHGLAGTKVGRFRIYVNLSLELAKLGIASFRLDFRGNGDSEGNFADMTVSGQIEDALIGLEWLKSHPEIDADRIGFMGRSFGGAVSLLTSEKFPNVKSIALWSPVFSGDQWREHWHLVASNLATEEEAERLRTINGQIAGLPFYEELFVMNIGKRLEALSNVPLLHIHGGNDQLVDLTHRDQYKKIRAKSSAASKFLIIEGADHDFSDVNQIQKTIDETAHWFSITLGEKS